MCVVKTPKIPKPDPSAASKPPPIIRNPILDGLLGNIAATRAGTSAFRIDLINPLTIPTGGGLGGGAASGGGGSGGGSSTGSGSTSTSGGNFSGGDTFGRTGRTPSAL